MTDRSGELARVVRGNEEAGLPVGDEFRDPADPGSDHGRSLREGFQEDEPERLVLAGKYGEAGIPIGIGEHGVVPHVPEDPDPSAEAGSGARGLDRAAHPSVLAHEHERRFRVVPRDGGESLDQRKQPLVRRQAADEQDVRPGRSDTGHGTCPVARPSPGERTPAG